jgi:septum formation protein
VLASTSPRRKSLLGEVGIPFEIAHPEVDETPLAGEGAKACVLRLSLAKAEEIASRNPDAWILAADTLVEINGEILGKPADRPDVFRMLERLSGRGHTVWTGFALVRKRDGGFFHEAVSSLVSFRRISGEEIGAYSLTAEPYDKAGAYAVQGASGRFIERIEGSRSNVMGLPLDQVRSCLARVLNLPPSSPYSEIHPTSHSE